MLYIEPILRLGGRKLKFSYTGDVAILQIRHTLIECTEKLEREAQVLLDWGRQDTISFDRDKCELQHFTLAPRPKEYTPMTLNGSTFPSNQVTRWFEALLDRKLSFLNHSKYWVLKGITVAVYLNRLNNKVKGSTAYMLRHTAKACVLPVAFFGAMAWWLGGLTLKWKRKKLQTKKHRYGQHLKMLSKAINLSLRVISLVFRTFPNLALHREAGIPTAHTILEEIRLGRALRIQKLDLRHHLSKRAYSLANTRLTVIAHLLPSSCDPKLACLDNIISRETVLHNQILMTYCYIQTEALHSEK